MSKKEVWEKGKKTSVFGKKTCMTGETPMEKERYERRSARQEYRRQDLYRWLERSSHARECQHGDIISKPCIMLAWQTCCAEHMLTQMQKTSACLGRVLCISIFVCLHGCVFAYLSVCVCVYFLLGNLARLK